MDGAAGVHARVRPRPGGALYTTLTRQLRRAGGAGITTLRGEWGFSSDERPFGDRIATLASHLPTYTVLVDRPRRIAELWPMVDEITARHGVVTAALVPAYRERAGALRNGALTLRSPEEIARLYRAARHRGRVRPRQAERSAGTQFWVPILATDPNTVSTGVPRSMPPRRSVLGRQRRLGARRGGLAGSLRGRPAARPRAVRPDRFVRFEGDVDGLRAAHADAEVLDARPGSALADPGPLLAAVRERARVPRSLVIFDSLDALSARWGDEMAQRFFTRACPMLLDLWAVAYWSLTPSHHSPVLRQAIDATTQCVLVLGGGRLRIAKAEGRPPGVQGSVFRVQPNGSHAELEGAPTAARLGAALRAIRIQRHLSQGELAELAGVSASAISQAERGRRGLALDTLLELTSAVAHDHR